MIVTLMFVDNGNAKQSHLLLPGANTIVLDNLTIHQAILQGDSATVTQCKINENVINEHMRDGETLLMKALRECAPNIVQILLEKGADPNRATPKGVTPLMVAVDVDLQQKGLVSLLIKNHAKLNLQKENGETALIMACNKGHLEIIHLLLNSGADVKPALTYLEKNIDKLVRVPLHLRPVLQHALNTHAERFREITETMLKALLDSNKMRLGTALMSCRCISPNELEEHDFYFKCDVNASEPRINVVMLALPVMFEKDGGININFEAIDRAVNEVYLNNEEPVAVLPGSKSLYFLFPDIGQVNILKIKTTCPYKVLLCVYELTYGTITQPQKQIQSVPQVPVH